MENDKLILENENEPRDTENEQPAVEQEAPAQVASAPSDINEEKEPSPSPTAEEDAQAVAHRLARKRRLRYGAYATLITAAVIAVAVVLNVIVSLLTDKYPLSIDLTSTGMFDISDESKEYIAGLAEDVEITVLADKAAVMNGSEYMAQVGKTIEAYAQNSPRVSITYVDLTANPTFAANYSGYDLAANDVIVQCGGRIRVVSMSDMLNYNTDNYYYTGSYTIESSAAEQVMTNALMYVTSGEVPSVVFLTGLGEVSSADLQELLTSNSYDVSEVNILTGDIPEGTDVVVWFGPTGDPTEAQLKKLDAYLENGGDLMIFVDAMVSGQETLDAFLAEWGLAQTYGVAFETDSNRIISSPYLPIVQYTDGEFAGELASSRLYTAFYTPKPVSTLFETSGFITTKTLLSLSETSGWHNADVTSEYQIKDEDLVGNIGVMVMATMNDSAKVSNVVLAGSSTSFTGEFLTNSALVNAQYIIGVFNKLCDRGDMVTIAAKDFTTQSNNMTAGQVTGAVLVFMVLIPLAVLATGIFVWVKRRHR